LLFNIYIQQLIEEVLENIENEVKVNRWLVKAVRFPDDQAMVSSSNAGLQRMIDTLNKTLNDYGMKINIKKTEVMRVCKTGGKKMKITGCAVAPALC